MRVLMFNEGDQWVAQAIEHDICASGRTQEEAQFHFELTVQAEMQEGDGVLDAIPPAPQDYADMWDRIDPSSIREEQSNYTFGNLAA